MFTLNTVRIFKTKGRDREEMRFVDSAESNLWFDFGSPWQPVSWKEGLSVSPGTIPAALINLLGLWEWLTYLLIEMHRVKKKKKSVATKFLGTPKVLLVGAHVEFGHHSLLFWVI